MPASRRRVIRAMCPMSCHPTLCGMLVEIEDGRLVNVMGDQDNPDSQGFLCVRGQASREIIGNPGGVAVAAITDSLLSPAARHADLVLPVEAEPVSFVDAQCAPQAIIATLLVEYGLRARERTEAGLGSFERLAVRHAFFHTDD